MQDPNDNDSSTPDLTRIERELELRSTHHAILALREHGSVIGLQRLRDHGENIAQARARGVDVAEYTRACTLLADRLQGAPLKRVVDTLGKRVAAMQAVLDTPLQLIDEQLLQDLAGGLRELNEFGFELEVARDTLEHAYNEQRKRAAMREDYWDSIVASYADLKHCLHHPAAEDAGRIAENLKGSLAKARAYGLDVDGWEEDIHFAIRRYELAKRVGNAQGNLEKSKDEMTEREVQRVLILIEAAQKHGVATHDLEDILDKRRGITRARHQRPKVRQNERRQTDPAPTTRSIVASRSATRSESGPKHAARRSPRELRTPKPKLAPEMDLDELVRLGLRGLRKLIPGAVPGAATARMLLDATLAAFLARAENFEGTYEQFFAQLHTRGFTTKLISKKSGGDALRIFYKLTKLFYKDDETRHVVARFGELRDPSSKLIAELRRLARTLDESDLQP